MTLLEAVKSKNTDHIKAVIYQNPQAIKGEGKEALFLAAEQGDLGVLKYLVEYSAVNLGDRAESGRCALSYGVKSRNLEIVQYLTERGGLHPFGGDLEGKTPYDIAHENGDSFIEKYFAHVVGADYEETYHNPVITGLSSDPSILRVEEDYYMVHSSFCYFPCIPVYHSRDLINWELIGHGITRAEYAHLDGLESGRGYWAADLSYYDGRFYIAATYRLNDVNGLRRKQMITSAKRPEGPYEEPVFIEEDGIDPSLFCEEDGRRYMLLNRGARLMEISKDGKKVLSKPELLWYGNQKTTPEGPHLLKKDGYYYLIQAEGGTGRGHSITISRSKNLKGPYESCPHNPILHQQEEAALVQCCGHGKFVETQYGEWYMVYLCARMQDGRHGILGRETALDPVEWSLDGWPIINGGRGPGVQQKRPRLPPWKPEKATLSKEGVIPWEDLSWVTPRAPYPHTIRKHGSGLFLFGTKEDLNSTACLSIYLQKQLAFDFTVRFSLYVSKAELDKEFGLTCYYDENSYIKFGVLWENDRCSIILKEYVDRDYIREEQISISSMAPCCMELEIKTQGFTRVCSYRVKESDWISIGVCEHTQYLSSEGLKKGKRFTGAMVGVYAVGEAESRFEAFSMGS